MPGVATEQCTMTCSCGHPQTFGFPCADVLATLRGELVFPLDSEASRMSHICNPYFSENVRRCMVVIREWALSMNRTHNVRLRHPTLAFVFQCSPSREAPLARWVTQSTVCNIGPLPTCLLLLVCSNESSNARPSAPARTQGVQDGGIQTPPWGQEFPSSCAHLERARSDEPAPACASRWSSRRSPKRSAKASSHTWKRRPEPEAPAGV